MGDFLLMKYKSFPETDIQCMKYTVHIWQWYGATKLNQGIQNARSNWMVLFYQKSQLCRKLGISSYFFQVFVTVSKVFFFDLYDFCSVSYNLFSVFKVTKRWAEIVKINLKNFDNWKENFENTKNSKFKKQSKSV